MLSNVYWAPTIACQPISNISSVASTCEGPECIGAGSVCVTGRVSHTLVDICRWERSYIKYWNCYTGPSFHVPSGSYVERAVLWQIKCWDPDSGSMLYVQHIPIPVLTAWCNTRSLQTKADCVLIGCYCSITCIVQSPTAHDSGHYSRMTLHSRTVYALTAARHSISTVSWVASTREGPDCVGAGSACMARRLSTTLINIYTRSKK